MKFPEGPMWQRRREASGLDQDAAAEAAGVSRVTLSRYETGLRVMPVEVQRKLHDAYGPVARETSIDYAAGMLAAAALMSDTVAALIRQASGDGKAAQVAAALDNPITPTGRAGAPKAAPKKRRAGGQ